MSTVPKTRKAKKATTKKKAVKTKKPSMENTGTGKNNPVTSDEKDTDIAQYQDIDSGKESDNTDGIHQTVDESDNIGKDIYNR
jgi:hypothetical protein